MGFIQTVLVIYTRKTASGQSGNYVPVGLRNLDELDPDAYHILAVGDSFTFGPFISDMDTWPAQLEAELHNRDPQRPVQVLNAGIAGYTIADELAHLQDKGVALNPDMVIIQVYPNDVSDYRAHKREEFARPDKTSTVSRPAPAHRRLRPIPCSWIYLAT